MDMEKENLSELLLDGRGLSELERCRKNYEMLNMILDEWMPWHKTAPNFSTIDISRYLEM